MDKPISGRDRVIAMIAAFKTLAHSTIQRGAGLLRLRRAPLNWREIDGLEYQHRLRAEWSGRQQGWR
jgi:hypothetical protein